MKCYLISLFVGGYLLFGGSSSLVFSDLEVRIPFSIEKVTQRDSASYDQGRPSTPLGYQFNYFDKFYSPPQLSSNHQGEIFIVEWNCSKVLSKKEEFQIIFSYRSTEDWTIHHKKLDVSIDRTGFYETAIEHVGEEFQKEGRVESWKVVLLNKEGTPLSQKTSTLWTE
ncbi:MAG: hypothetical protein HYS07_00300 [Chlamydiae bacterium]|nr:hypothetical protein [Chlamydiota bacterium]MBI3276348.1 hypothetical protein [Chlamydiota bacterium]